MTAIRRMTQTAFALSLACACAMAPSGIAHADNVTTLDSQFEFVENACDIDSLQPARAELESLGPGWNWVDDYAGGGYPAMVYHLNNLYDGAYPLDAHILYKKIGKVDGRWVDARIHYTGATPWPSSYYGDSVARVNLSTFWGGCVYFCLGKLDQEYQLYWNGTTEQLDITGIWMTFCSLNNGESVQYNADGEIDTTVLRGNNLTQLGSGHWKGISNNFSDHMGTETYCRNAVSFRVKSSNPSITMRSDSGAFWMFPLFTPLANVRPPDPTKTCTVID